MHAGPFKCYYPDRDIVIPSFYLKDERPIDPLSTARNISLLVRFNADRYGQYNDNVRGRLLDYWKVGHTVGQTLARLQLAQPAHGRLCAAGIPVSQCVDGRPDAQADDAGHAEVHLLRHAARAGAPGPSLLLARVRQAGRCSGVDQAGMPLWTGSFLGVRVSALAAPQAQWTTRFYRAIVSGCIPVTWYVNMRQPYQDFLGLDYSKFTVNIMPSQLGVTNDVLAAIQRTPGRLRAMQLELRRVQARCGRSPVRLCCQFQLHRAAPLCQFTG